MNPIAKNAVIHIKCVDFFNVEIEDDDLVLHHHSLVLNLFTFCATLSLWNVYSYIFAVVIDVIYWFS